DPAIAPSLDLLDLAGALYPPLARGEVRGEQVLLGAGHVGLWGEYFSNRHPIYAINNVIAAAAALPRLPAGPFSILELGAGGGSASEELLGQLERAGRLGDLARYEVTEPSTFFRRRAERALRARFPGVPLSFSALDIDAPLDPEGPAAGRFDLVLGVNVLHVARDLPAALARLAERLSPGGWLVGGECVRLFPGQPIAAEMVFLAMEGFVEVALDPERRPEPGFLTPELWRGLFTEAGLAPVELVPDLVRIRDLYAHFNAGAICGRRPL
ncbi:MAG TPA: class I SAM-dependent methyltransferase, partial [Thermoanaerobaculia bacterium]|nr:class I SAM-dependent methyltransferase [Thermoanaerobaculia bacterium]